MADAEDRGALPPLNPEVAAQFPGLVRGYIWPTEFLMFADFLEATPHAHSALQLMVGIDHPVRMDFGAGWVETHGALVDTDVQHGFDGSRGLFGGGWVEAESRLGTRLQERFLEGRDWAPLDQDTAMAVADAIKPALSRDVVCHEAHARWRSGLAVLIGDADDDPDVDERVQAVLDHLREVPSPPPSVEELSAVALLSESRLQHLFREQVGVPIRRYLRWHRVLTAMGLLADGVSITDAAHAAGFSDAPHFNRTMRRMQGAAPSDLGPVALWLSNCR